MIIGALLDLALAHVVLPGVRGRGRGQDPHRAGGVRAAPGSEMVDQAGDGTGCRGDAGGGAVHPLAVGQCRLPFNP